MNIALEAILAKLPIEAIKTTIQRHIRPLEQRLPDKRLGRVIEAMLLGILGGETPVITEMARENSKEDGESWAMAKRMVRLLEKKHLETSDLYEGLYQVGSQAVAQETPEYLVVAVDPVNFEKPYTKVIEGVSIVHKATPPDLTGHARLAHGYPAITATLVNTRVPVTSYANWFSYEIDFISQNNEIEQAFQTTCRLYPGDRIRFVGDSGLDDQKMFAQVGRLGQEFVFRASHLERIVEVYNTRLDQEQGLDVEDMRVHSLARMRRLFAIVLLSAQMVFVIAVHWPPKAVLWLRQLGGKLDLASDRDGPDWLLHGISAVIVTAMTLSFVFLHPFPFGEITCG